MMISISIDLPPRAGGTKSKHWMKHIAVAPKGLLRYYVLELLSEESRSGSELMDLIEERSRGLWRPSPGSIYPLLEWLKDRGYVKEAQTGDINVRRYSLTEKGRKFLEEQREIKAFMMRTWRFFAPYVLDTFFYKNLNDKQYELIHSVRMFMQTLFSLQSERWEKNSRDYMEQVITIVKDATSKLEELKRKMESGSNG